METADKVDVSHYAYRVTWSAEDGEFVATCVEFPSLSWLALTQVEALTGLEQMVVDVVEDMEREGEEVPRPISERGYSGKFNLRVGERLHRRLAMRAAEEKLSINQYIIRQLNL